MQHTMKLHITQAAQSHLVEIGLQSIKQLDARTPQDAWLSLKAFVAELLNQLEAEPVRRLPDNTILLG